MLRRRRDQRGAAAVEFAMIVPLFAALLFGIIEFGFYFWTAEGTNSGAREVARRVTVGDCWSSGQLTLAQSHSPRATSVSASPDPSSLEVGDLVTVHIDRATAWSLQGTTAGDALPLLL